MLLTKYQKGLEKEKRKGIGVERIEREGKITKTEFPASGHFKLKSLNLTLWEVIKIINNNAYTIDLPREFIMSSTFNVADLKEYYPPKPNDFENSRMNAASEWVPDVAHTSKGAPNCAPTMVRITISLNQILRLSQR